MCVCLARLRSTDLDWFMTQKQRLYYSLELEIRFLTVCGSVQSSTTLSARWRLQDRACFADIISAVLKQLQTRPMHQGRGTLLKSLCKTGKIWNLFKFGQSSFCSVERPVTAKKKKKKLLPHNRTLTDKQCNSSSFRLRAQLMFTIKQLEFRAHMTSFKNTCQSGSLSH